MSRSVPVAHHLKREFNFPDNEIDTENKRQEHAWSCLYYFESPTLRIILNKKADLTSAFGVCPLKEQSPSSLHRKPALAGKLTHQRVLPVLCFLLPGLGLGPSRVSESVPF